jgi:hypothetical protein
MEPAEGIRRPLGELLVGKGLVTREELDLALAEQSESGRLLGTILVEHGFISGPALAVALAEHQGVELATERGFGTGLWAEIARRHRVERRHSETPPDNVVSLAPVKLPQLEGVPDPGPDPEVEGLEAENRRLQDELERLRTPKLVDAPRSASAHLLFVPASGRYVLFEREGAPPEPGSELDVAEVERGFVVAKVGRAPFPGESRPCAFLLPRR